MMVVDGDISIQASNKAARPLFGAEPEAVLHRRGGDALGCIHHFESPLGCGRADACRSCIIRGSVDAAIRGDTVQRRLTRVELKTAAGVATTHVRVTAAPFETQGARLVLLAIEDVSDLIQLQSLLPICAWCKKVRTGEKYWEAVDTFLARKLSIDFSHSICEKCMEKHFPEDTAGPA
jgi:hypothetical protein